MMMKIGLHFRHKRFVLFGNRVYKISANQVGSISNYKIDVLSGLSQVDYERLGLLIIKILIIKRRINKWQ